MSFESRRFFFPFSEWTDPSNFEQVFCDLGRFGASGDATHEETKIVPLWDLAAGKYPIKFHMHSHAKFHVDGFFCPMAPFTRSGTHEIYHQRMGFVNSLGVSEILASSV